MGVSTVGSVEWWRERFPELASLWDDALGQHYAQTAKDLFTIQKRSQPTSFFDPTSLVTHLGDVTAEELGPDLRSQSCVVSLARQLDRVSDPTARTRLLSSLLSAVHEQQHFYDTLMTPTGHHILILMRDILRLSTRMGFELAEERRVIAKPLGQYWLDVLSGKEKPDSPIAKFLDVLAHALWGLGTTRLSHAIGTEPPPTSLATPCLTPFSYRCLVPHNEVFPAVLTRSGLVRGGRRIAVVGGTVAPIGMDLIFETRSMLMERATVSTFLPASRATHMRDARLAESPLYLAGMALMTRVAKEIQRLPAFDRDLAFQLMGLALSPEQPLSPQDTLPGFSQTRSGYQLCNALNSYLHASTGGSTDVRQSMDLDEFRSSEASFFKRAVLDAKLYNAQHPVGDPLRGRREKPADDDSVIRSLSGAPRLSAYLTSYLYRHHRSSLAAENLQYCELTLGEALLHAHTTPVPFLSLSDTLVVSPLMEGYDADDMWADLVSWVVHFATIEQAIRVHELVCPMHLDRYAAFLPILRERVLQCRECVAKGGPVVVMLGRKSELGDCPFRQHLEALALIPRD